MIQIETIHHPRRIDGRTQWYCLLSFTFGLGLGLGVAVAVWMLALRGLI